MSETLSLANDSYTRPMGPLEKGDQALVDAVDNLKPGKFSKSRTIRGGHTEISSSTNWAPPVKIVETLKYRNGIPLFKKDSATSTRVNISDRGIVAERYETADITKLERGVIGTNGNLVSENGGPYQLNRERAQAFKMEVAQHIEEVQDYIGEVTVNAASHQ